MQLSVVLTLPSCVSQVHVGDFVEVCPSDAHVALYIAQVYSMWENKNGEKMFHALWLRSVTRPEL